MLAPAPRIEQVITSLRQFIGDAVFVAHNASFDLGFVKAAFERAGFDDFSPTVVDTLTLSRRLFRDEVRNFKLGTLAQRFGIENRPSHRALDDALATRDLLYLLIERAAGWGVTGLDDLVAVGKLTGHPQAKKLRLTESLPRSPGVYLMVDDHDVVTYVGKATNLRQRVRSYFGNDERRSVIPMLRHLSRIEHIATPDVFTAEVLERRLISSLAPRHNRVGRKKRRPIYVRLDTNELWPRLSIVYQTRSQGQYLGPLPDATRPSRPSKPFRPHTRFVDAPPTSGLDTSSNPMRLRVLQPNSVLPRARVQDLPTLLHMHQQSRVLLLRCRVKVNMSSMRSLSGCEASPYSRGSKRLRRYEIACRRCYRQPQLHDSLMPSPLLDARFTLAGIDHQIDQGLVDLDHLGVIHRFDTSEADTDAERLLVARMIQRASAQSRTISNVESSGQWRFPLSEPTVDRLC